MRRMAGDQKLDELRQVRVFARCRPAELRRISAVVDEVTVPAGQVLAEQGRPGRACHLLLEGTADVAVGGQVVGTLRRGDAAGLVAALDLLPHEVSVVTTTPCRLYTLTARALRDLVVELPELGLALLGELGGRVREASAAPEPPELVPA